MTTTDLPNQNDNKRRKKSKPIDPNRCEFILLNKKRRCGMMRQKDHRFCLDHQKLQPKSDDVDAQDRIPCPLDPKHTVWKNDLEQHLKKCNARAVETHEAWYKKNYNTVLQSQIEVPKKSNELDLCATKTEEQINERHQVFTKVIELLKEYSKTLEPLLEKVYRHPGLDSWVQAKENKKHILQQSSLAGLLKELELLNPHNFFVEFGCGKGELSRTINACVVSDYNNQFPKDCKYGFGFIDRGCNRMKVDNKILQDCEKHEIHPHIKRSRIDIEHLVVDKFLESVEPDGVVAISKHLCGVATDLTLKCLLNLTTTLKNLKGLVVAMCCRHVCDYEQMLPESREYLAANGIEDDTMFSVLKKVVTWAVCGSMTGDEDPNYKEKEQLGLIARSMIDNARVTAINKLMPLFHARLTRYATMDITLENHCLQITKRQ
ncbi:hypothetical protein PUMCH_000382 [Australozyma saopauloensis]|uniref:tRNA:m(4)X modification enzyme TRM13 n=1 Tax=Australozyma saopauloensis TaxID=291208 RepID=A0AAX4H3J9_9ASCO|nr:hypothetical protein PUMCH_000382 [[Candida] saopauloensis]